jgi:hypothetical protein
MALSRITAASIEDGTVVAADIATGTITGDKIGVGQITANLFAPGAVSTTSISNGNSNVTIASANSDVSIFTAGIEAMRIDSGQRTKFPTTIGVGGATPSTSGAGITFPATASASSNANTLDDYEEGTWTPVVVGTSTAGTASYVSQANAIYTKIGRAVTIQVWLEWSSGTGTGDLRMSGLPFTVNANYQAVPCVARMGPKITLTANNVLVTVFQQNTTQIVFNQYETGGSENATVAYDAAAGVFIAGTYTVA